MKDKRNKTGLVIIWLSIFIVIVSYMMGRYSFHPVLEFVMAIIVTACISIQICLFFASFTDEDELMRREAEVSRRLDELKKKGNRNHGME